MNKILTFIFVICLGILYPFTIRGQEQGAFFVPEEDREADLDSVRKAFARDIPEVSPDSVDFYVLYRALTGPERFDSVAPNALDSFFNYFSRSEVLYRAPYVKRKNFFALLERGIPPGRLLMPDQYFRYDGATQSLDKAGNGIKSVYIVRKGKAEWEYYYVPSVHSVSRRNPSSSLSRKSMEEEAYRYVVGQFRLPDTACLFYMESIPEHFLFRVTTSGQIYLLHQYRGTSYLLYPKMPGETAFPMDGDW